MSKPERWDGNCLIRTCGRKGSEPDRLCPGHFAEWFNAKENAFSTFRERVEREELAEMERKP